jgi:tetratricopeptide (TPR) repeat protein
MVHARRRSKGCSFNILCCPFALVIFFIFVLRLPIADAETLILESGRTVHGKVLERTDKTIKIDVGLDFPITYYLDEVDRVETEGPAQQETKSERSQEDDANALELQGLDFIDQNKMVDGIELLRKAIGMDPKPNRHLNLGAILSGNGIALFKEGRKDEAAGIFKEAESELNKAIGLFDHKKEITFLSHAYYLLGELHAQAFGNPAKAREYYQKSISLYENPAAQRGLKALSSE